MHVLSSHHHHQPPSVQSSSAYINQPPTTLTLTSQLNILPSAFSNSQMSSAAAPSTPVPESPRPADPSTTVNPVVSRSSLFNSYSRYFSFLCRLLAALVLAYLMVIVISLILQLSMKPSLPVLGVHSVSVADLNTSLTGQLDANISVTLVFTNHNKKLTVLLWKIKAIVLYGKTEHRSTLATARMTPFSIGAESVRSVRVVFPVMNGYMDSDVVNGILDEQGRGLINFEVVLSARMKFKIGIMRSMVGHWNVGCYPVPISFPPNHNGTGILLDPIDGCGVY